MDDQRFDMLARATARIGTRRLAMSGGGFTLLAGGRIGIVGAHDTTKRCKNIKDKSKRDKCAKDAKKHKQWHATNACRSAGQTCASRPCCPGEGLVCVNVPTSTSFCAPTGECLRWLIEEVLSRVGDTIKAIILAANLFGPVYTLIEQGRIDEARDKILLISVQYGVPVPLPFDCFPVSQVE